MKKLFLKYILKNKPSWDVPITKLILRILNPLDYITRATRNLQYLPPYSIRVRSNGMSNQFGGKRFATEGRLLFKLIQEHASLNTNSKVLELGCGCGRTAIVLAEYLTEGNYIGMDIEKISLNSNISNNQYGENFIFEHMDIYNLLYNPKGKHEASTYIFPYNDNEFDLIFHFSVFTHMRTKDVVNYIKETGRLLRKGGHCVFSMFIVTNGNSRMSLDKYSDEGFYYCNESFPEAAIGYRLDFIVDTFNKYGLSLKGNPLKDSGFPQDIVVFEKTG